MFTFSDQRTNNGVSHLLEGANRDPIVSVASSYLPDSLCDAGLDRSQMDSRARGEFPKVLFAWTVSPVWKTVNFLSILTAPLFP